MTVATKNLIRFILEELRTTDIRLAHPRRQFEDWVIEEGREDLQTNFYGLLEGIEYMSQREWVSGLARHTQELASLLYVLGRPAFEWQKWVAISALAVSMERIHNVLAVQYAIIGGEISLLSSIRNREPDSMRISDLVAWQIVFPEWDIVDAKDRPSDPWSEVWISMLDSFKKNRFERFQWFIQEAADCAMEDRQWREYEYLSFPVFEPDICSVVLLARNRGVTFDMRKFSRDVVDFLHPALVDLPKNDIRCSIR